MQAPVEAARLPTSSLFAHGHRAFETVRATRRHSGRGSILLAVLLAGQSGAIAADKPSKNLSEPVTIEVKAKVLTSFTKPGGSAALAGGVTFVGGLQLTSEHPAFGGWSGLAIAADGRKLLSVSDAGAWMTAELALADGRPAGLTNVRIGPLKARSGAVLSKDRERDAEAVTLLSGSLDKGTVLVSFERLHRIGHFPVGSRGVGVPTHYVPLPRELTRLKSNKGLEAIAIVAGGPDKGALVVFAEANRRDEARHIGWIWRAGRPRAFHLTNPEGFEVTDAASLPNGDLLVLERRFRWLEGVRMRLRRIESRFVRPDAETAGDTLITADMRAEIDNMEGLAVHHAAKGGFVVTLISDDNFNRVLQRTLLLQFHLADHSGATKR